MIGISFNKREFEYDAYTLVKAFYPQEEVENFYEEDAEEKKAYDLLVRITYGDDKTHLSLERDGEIIFGEAARFEKGQERKERKNLQRACAGDRHYPSLGESDGHTPYQDRHGAD